MRGSSTRTGTDLHGPAFAGNPTADRDGADLDEVVQAVVRVGEMVAETFRPDSRPADFSDVRRMLDDNDRLAQSPLRQALMRLRPDAGWVEDEDEAGMLPEGEWWVTDAVEGNINKVHGIPEFCTSATLVRNNRPVLTCVHLPLTGETYTAVAGAGATRNGEPLRVSTKRSLDGAVVATAQNGAHEPRAAARRLGDAVAAFLEQNAIVRVAPPPTLQMLHVAAGRADLFWQFGAGRSGLLAGALLVSEAGGAVTDTRGRLWRLDSDDFLAATPAVHERAVALLGA